RNPEAVHGCRHANVNRDLQKHFFDLILSQTVGEGAFHVRFDLMRTIERGEHGKIQHAACLAIQARTAPDLAPAILGHEFLQWTVEVICGRKSVIDKIRSQNLAPNGKPFLEHFLIHVKLLSVNKTYLATNGLDVFPETSIQTLFVCKYSRMASTPLS